MLSNLNTLKQFALATALVGGLTLSLPAAEPGWLTGEPLKAKLSEPAGGAWDGTPLRASLSNFSKTQRVPIVLDRRVDPGQPLRLNFGQNVSLKSVLDQIAGQTKCGVGFVGGVAYFGPPATAVKLRTVAALRREELAQVPATLRPKYLRLKGWKWDDLKPPRELLSELGTEVEVKFVGGEAIPHDLWAGCDWPPLNWIDRLTLILAQYDLTFEFDPAGDRVKFVPLPEKPTLAKSYPAGDNIAEVLQKVARLLPNAKTEQSGSQFRVTGTAEELEVVTDLLAGKPVKVSTTKTLTKIDKLNVKDAPVGALLKTLAQRLELELRIDEEGINKAGISLDKLVSVSADNITVEELFRRATKDTGLTFRINGKAIEILPAR